MATARYLTPLTLEEYLALPEDEGCEQEVIRGRLVVAPAPFALHQFVVARIYDRLARHVVRSNGTLVQVVWDADLLMDALDTYVSPDLMYFPPAAAPALLDLMARRQRIHVAHVRPDLVVEVLSRGGEARDLVDKARDYANAGIPHYWVIDPEARRFRELVLPPDGGAYVEVTHARRRVRPQLFAGQRPAFSFDLDRLWPS